MKNTKLAIAVLPTPPIPVFEQLYYYDTQGVSKYQGF